MSRQNIFEILSSEYNIEKEFNKINSLFETRLIRYTNPLNFGTLEGAIENIINSCFLLTWKQRGSYFSCAEMRDKIGFTIGNYNEDNVITTLEYYINLINLLNLRLKSPTIRVNYQFYNEFYLLKQNIDILLEHLNYEKIIIDEEEKVLLVPKNISSIAVAEISTKNTAFSILKYNHTALKGNLEEKRNILNSIYLEYEPLLKSPPEGYGDFFNKTNALLNTLHIRHNNKAKENNKNRIVNLNDDEMEKWYDELY